MGAFTRARAAYKCIPGELKPVHLSKSFVERAGLPHYKVGIKVKRNTRFINAKVLYLRMLKIHENLGLDRSHRAKLLLSSYTRENFNVVIRRITADLIGSLNLTLITSGHRAPRKGRAQSVYEYTEGGTPPDGPFPDYRGSSPPDWDPPDDYWSGEDEDPYQYGM